MTPTVKDGGWGSTPLRVRLAVLIGIALLPVLLLGLVSGALILGRPSGDGAAQWRWLALALPVFGFVFALAGVAIVVDQEAYRWIARLRGAAAVPGEEDADEDADLDAASFTSAAPEVRALARGLDAMTAAIVARDRALSENLIQRDGLLREIHHRVKNNLQVISSLLNLQQRSLADPAARAAMSDTRQRIAALALIYRALYEGADLRKVNLADFLEELIGQLILTDTGQSPAIRTELAIDALTIDPDHLAPLALFAVEAITNAKKHGLTEGGGRLAVNFSVRGQEAELAITDSGRPGSAAVVVGEGVGRTLMSAFARQLGGAVSFCPQPAGGLTARLTFPTPEVAP
ncbi:MAG: sensor histidine kinase [Caulobacteraceae bacterium]|nr:sensor histidine kinase [Caulobacteraceae bacterium]